MSKPMHGVVGVDDTGSLAVLTVEEFASTSSAAEHPDLSAHETLGLAAADHTHAAGSHPDLATHDALGLATDDELTTHAATTHGTTAHDIAGVLHSGTLDHASLNAVSADQHHSQAHALDGLDHSGSLAQASVTNLTTDLAAKADTTHNHDAAYSTIDHTHAGGDHPDLAAHDTLGLATQAELDAHTHTLTDSDIPSGIARDAEVTTAISDHAGAADPHTGYLKENDANWTDLTDGGETALHTHAGGSEAFPVGSVFLSVVATNPATLLGYGTWAAFGAGRVLIGNDGATYGTDEATGGAATASISAHANGAVAQHAAQSHSAHAGATVGNHTDVTNHVHVQTVNSATTGGTSGYTPDTSTNNGVASGYSTANPTSVGVAAMVHSVGQANPHSDHAALTHTVTQPDDHSDVSTVQPYIVVHMWKRTA